MSRRDEKPIVGADQYELDVLTDLLNALFTDLSRITSIDVTRDIQTINQRIQHEGLSFVTKTLPAFGKHILQAYSTGQFQRQPAFHTRRGRALPEFLIGFTELLFDKKSGVILDDPCYVSAWAVHQITNLLYKYELPYTWKVEQRVLDDMIRTNEELPMLFGWDPSVNTTRRDKILEFARSAVLDVFGDVSFSQIYPKHGPGATNEGTLNQYEKYRFRALDRLGNTYPEDDYYNPSPVSACEGVFSKIAIWKPQMCISGYEKYLFPEEKMLDPVLRTTVTHCVPKDSRGPRVISAEAKELMWIQQGQARLMQKTLQSHKLTKGHVNFDDQSVNAALALRGSLAGDIATLDMKEASDRVSCALVAELLPPQMFTALWASRSFWTLIHYPVGPNEKQDRLIRLRKFAPMGSAVCFPLESLVFWALAVAVVQECFNKSRSEAASDVYIYGDDLIVPVDMARVIMAEFEQFGLLFNKAKSFYTGPFRESCGTDAFLGVNITPVRLKKRMPVRREDASSIVGWTASANLADEKGLHGLASHLRDRVEALIGPLPEGPPDSPVLSRTSRRPFEEYLPRARARPILLVPKYRGETFVVLKKDAKSFARPDLQGFLLKGWAAETAVHRPSQEEFPEENAYMHYVSLKADTPAVQEDVRAFSRRHVVKLRRRVAIVT